MTSLDLNFKGLIVNKNGCRVKNGTVCGSKEVFDPAKSSTEIELNVWRRRSTFKTITNNEYDINVTGIEYTDNVCLGKTPEGCVKP